MAVMLAISASSCGDSDVFTVSGHMAGDETQSLRIVYYGRNAVQTINAGARDGKFMIEGDAPSPAIIDILANDGRLIGQIYASNGDEIQCDINRSQPWKISISGNPVSEAWAKFIRDNEDAYKKRDSRLLNKAVESFVKANPKNVLSAVLVVTTYDAASDPAAAQRLLESIDPSAKPVSVVEGYASMLASMAVCGGDGRMRPFRYYARRSGNSTFEPSVHPLTLLSFTSASGKPRPDSIVEALKSAHRRYGKRRLHVLDIGFDAADTFAWRQAVRPDSALWTQGFCPGSIMTPGIDSLAIPSLPYFIVADSAGVQLYRGTSVSDACATVDSILK